VRARRSRKSAMSLSGTRNVNGCGIGFLEFILTFVADPRIEAPSSQTDAPLRSA
jgi:hypothetical protein